MRFLLLLILPILLMASSKILSYNIYDRSDRVDIMITFDTPYEGSIKQSSTQNSIIIKLQDSSIESSKIKNLNSKFIKSITITPLKDATQIEAFVPSNIKLQASKTADAYGLRLRLLEQQNTPATETNTLSLQTKNNISSLPTKQDDEYRASYYIAIMVLLFGLGIVLYIRKKVPLNANSLGKTQKSPWLFESTKQPNELSFAINPTDQNFSNEATIRFQKNIDAKNSVIMLDFLDQSYLVLMGENNLLLDKFTDNKPSSQNEFDIMLEHRYKQLDNFLNSDTKSALDSYKQKASNTLYDS